MGDLVQYLEDTPGRPQAKFFYNGALQNLDGACTVTLTRPDGTPGPVAGTVSNPSTGVYEITVDGPLDPYWYDVRWSGMIGGKAVAQTTRVEWLGGFLFNVGDLRAMRIAGGQPFKSRDPAPELYSDTEIQETRTEVLEEFTEILGFSPVPRFARETHSVGYGGEVLLDQLLPLRIISVSVAGVAGIAANYYLDGTRLIPATNYLAGYWATYGVGNVVVEYAHGWPRPKGDARDVAMLRAAMKLDPGISSTASTVTTPDGSSYSFDAAGQVTRAGNVRHFGVAAIDAYLNRHRQASIAVA